MNASVSLTKPKSRIKEAFLLGLLVGAAALLPYVIYDKGLFLYYGDFNVQQIPFYQLANEAVRTGNIWWSWKTDLGANFIGSYGFYLIFSPFFWLSLLVPPAFTPYLMAPLLALKSGCAAATGYLFLKRFVKDQDYAVFCSLLYAFSGYAVYNIFFNHFHEAIIFFPLMLVGLEEAMTENKWGRFALAIAVNAAVNYWFFIGEAIFIAVYFVVRFTDPSWRLTTRKFLCLGAEVVVGMGMAMVAFLPSVLAILGNPRTTESNLLLGNNLWYYSNPQRYLGILHSIFYTPDMPAINNWFPDHGAQWASLSAYIPLFSAAGVLAWCMAKRKSWLSRILITSGVMAMVPMLNHLFVLENYSYYARWFYMPTLMMVLATALALENSGEGGTVDLSRGMRMTAYVMLLLLVMVGLTPKQVNGEWALGSYKYASHFLATAAITWLGLLAAALLLRSRGSPGFKRKLKVLLVVGCGLYTFSALFIGKATYSDNRWITETALPGRDKMSMDAPGEFSRCDIYKSDDNLGMYWNLPNIQAFHSVVPTSIMEFYPAVGVKRDVSSKPETKFPELRSLLSVRWLYVKEAEKDQPPMRGYTLVENRLGYNIYENENFVPMGFTYDYYLDTAAWEATAKESRSRALLQAIYLDEETIAENQDILSPAEPGSWEQDDFSAYAAQRREESCTGFTVDRDGFTATSNFPTDELVFWSVPFDQGWSATVNGEPAEISKVNVGFMAVRVPAGESTVRFIYRTPGLFAGAGITGVSILLLLAYLAIVKRLPAEKLRNEWEQLTLEKFEKKW